MTITEQIRNAEQLLRALRIKQAEERGEFYIRHRTVRHVVDVEVVQAKNIVDAYDSPKLNRLGYFSDDSPERIDPCSKVYGPFETQALAEASQEAWTEDV